MKSTANEELKHVQALLKMEKSEDLEQYKKKVLNSSIKERKKDGICWYPVFVKKKLFRIR